MRLMVCKTIGGSCAIALMLVLISVVAGSCTGSPSDKEDDVADTDNERWETILPGHWWKIQLDRDQFKVIADSWQSEITTMILLEAICPDVARELPEECIGIFEELAVRWPTQSIDYWSECMQKLRFGRGRRDTGGMYEIYIGAQLAESTTFTRPGKLNATEDRLYRISLYTDNVLEPAKVFPGVQGYYQEVMPARICNSVIR